MGTLYLEQLTFVEICARLFFHDLIEFPAESDNKNRQEREKKENTRPLAPPLAPRPLLQIEEAVGAVDAAEGE